MNLSVFPSGIALLISPNNNLFYIFYRPHKQVIALTLTAIFLCNGNLSAGLMSLKNGDQVSGELIKLEANHIHWASENFGTLIVPTETIHKIDTSTTLKINGRDDPCALTGMSRGRMLFLCNGDEEISNQLSMMKTLLPYEEFAAGAYSYRGRLRAAGNFAEGNTSRLDWDVDSDVEFRRGDYRHRMAIVYDSRSRDDEPADEIFNISYQLDVFFDERWFSYNQISYGIDEPKNIEEEFSIGTGLGYQLWDNDLTALSVVTGVNYNKRNFEKTDVQDDLLDDSGSRDEAIRWRGGTDFRYRLPLSIALFHRNEILWSMSETDDWEFDSETGILIPLGSGLFSDLKVEYDYDNNLPNDQTKKSDTRIKLGLGYEW